MFLHVSHLYGAFRGNMEASDKEKEKEEGVAGVGRKRKVPSEPSRRQPGRKARKQELKEEHKTRLLKVTHRRKARRMIRKVQMGL
jgi:hypothetical protein